MATAASTFVAGYADGFAVVAAVAGAVAIITLVAVPTVRLGAESRAAAH